MYGFGSWLFTKYAIVGGDLRIETGLLFKRSRVVDLDRLESVDVVQPLVPRLLGLAEVRLEVAGGSSTEAPLAYLAVADARELKARLLALRVGVRDQARSNPRRSCWCAFRSNGWSSPPCYPAPGSPRLSPAVCSCSTWCSAAEG